MSNPVGVCPICGERETAPGEDHCIECQERLELEQEPFVLPAIDESVRRRSQRYASMPVIVAGMINRVYVSQCISRRLRFRYYVGDI